MSDDDGWASRRQPWRESPDPAQVDREGWLGLSDDELLFRIEALPDDHGLDFALLQVVQSDRHFFVRQEAAKRIRDHHLLQDHSGDRHIGQIFVRGLGRSEDVAYLERLLVESRHVEVKKAAEAQLKLIAERRGQRRGPAPK